MTKPKRGRPPLPPEQKRVTVHKLGRKAGRPVVGNESVKLYPVYLEPAMEREIRKRYGRGNRSHAVRRMYELLESK